MRADQLLVARGLARSRTAAQGLIAAGRVSMVDVAGLTSVTKPAQDIPDSAELRVQPAPEDRYVSRGGLKLAGALARTGIDVAGQVCLDVGQSTGGFTDCLLQQGAQGVVGVDVGHGQLAARLREDARVTCLEHLNARALDAAMLGPHLPPRGFDLIVCDASFISLTLLLPRWAALLAAHGRVLALVKPQFELGPDALGNGGIVRDAAQYPALEVRMRRFADENGLRTLDYFDSPITGGDGNREFFLFAARRPAPDHHD
ncbi:TlyA family RNA methyltransferase [Methyloversatilis thermotolerans]|uniref:TlyA family RNA methyltransferase n=1 Tax=Methyloversatilis thermotolerans TaxID=1346290 RepID=UPI0003733EC1|nr:TlyA family RNA methyltransferase [Methyloversatilis thermotolerans]